MKKVNIISWRKGLVLSATFLLVGLTSVSCKKKNTVVGQNTINQDNILGSKSIDTFTLNTFTIQQDSIVSDNASLALLGQYQDPTFGSFSSDFYTQVVLEGLTPDFGDLSQIVVDSFVLGLEYSGVYGNAAEHILEVYEITEPNGMSIDSTYYSFSTLQTNPTNLVLGGHENVFFNRQNLTVIGNDTVDSQLRIHLDTNLAKSIMTRTETHPEDFGSNEAFLEYFKGLHVKATAVGNGGVHYFNLNDAASKLTIYYIDEEGEQKEFDFIINSECADFNHVVADNSGTKVETVIQDTVSGNTEFYTQSFASRAVVEIPGLDNLPDNIVIHKATLDLPVQYLTGSPYSIGSSITATRTLGDGTDDLYAVGLAAFNNSTKSVSMNLRFHIQEILSGQRENTGIIFSPILFISSAERIIFNGQNTTNKTKPKLTILYTEY